MPLPPLKKFEARMRNLLEKYEEQIRYLLVGFFNTVVGYSIFTIFLKIASLIIMFIPVTGEPISYLARHYYLVAQWASWVLCVPISTYTMRKYVFKALDGKFIHQLRRSYGIYLPAQLISMGLLIVFVNVFHLHPLVGQAGTIVVSTVMSYFGHKYFTFKAPLEVGEVVDEKLLDNEVDDAKA